MPHRPAPRRARRLLSRLLALVALATAWLLSPPAGAPAHAEAYAYWGYYQWSDGAWTTATEGPGTTRPADGTVDGWRFAVAGETTPARVPRAAGDFDLVCGSTPAEEGRKRVAVVLDYGVAEESPDGSVPQPRGACAVVPPDASGIEVLLSVADVRQDSSGLICGIDGFPASGCGGAVDEEPSVPTPEPTVTLALPAAGTNAEAGTDDATAQSTPATTTPTTGVDGPEGASGVTVLLIVGVALVVLIGAGALLRGRRDDEPKSAAGTDGSAGSGS